MNTIGIGSGGLAAVSIGLPLWIVAAVLLVAVVGIWKIVKILWATFG
jgi:hypothetical protein